MNLLKRKLSFFSLITVLGVVILGMQAIQAQLTTASISGIVADVSGGVIPGVSVSILQVETGSVRSAVTDEQGRYHVPLLQPGTYEVSAELVGFQTAVRSEIKVDVGGRAVVDLILNIGEISERVVVTGAAALVDTTDTTVAGLVDDKKIRDLPLNGAASNNWPFSRPGSPFIVTVSATRAWVRESSFQWLDLGRPRTTSCWMGWV